MDTQRADARELTPELQVGIARLRDELAALHAELARHGAFVDTGVLVSARVSGADLQLISTPAFVDALRPESLVLCDLDGVAIADTPGSDHAVPAEARLHGRLYRLAPDTHGIVRLRAPHVSGWAARREPLPCVLDVIAVEFGGDVPVAPAPTGDVDVDAAAIHAALGTHSSAVLLPRDGVLAVSADARGAARLAALAEDAAHAVDLAGPTAPRLSDERITALAASRIPEPAP